VRNVLHFFWNRSLKIEKQNSIASSRTVKVTGHRLEGRLRSHHSCKSVRFNIVRSQSTVQRLLRRQIKKHTRYVMAMIIINLICWDVQSIPKKNVVSTMFKKLLYCVNLYRVFN
jgi:hypothetical protein